MKIACLQFDCKLGNTAYNLKKAESIISRAPPENLENLDLLVLPEMAFSGYNFGSLGDISFCLEPTAAGPSTVWARSMARRLKCFVIVGYPEYAATSPSSPRASLNRFNSAVLVSPEGNVITNYRKQHLFITDETWADEGSGGFYAGNILNGLGKLSMGICMDLNPYRFMAPFEDYEFANHVLDNDSDLVVMPMNWLTAQHPSTLFDDAPVPDGDTLAYWIQRLQPILDNVPVGKEVIFVAANRCGLEEGANYAGTSAVVGISQGNVKVYGCLGRNVEDMLVCEVPLPKTVIRRTRSGSRRWDSPPQSPNFFY